MALSASAKAVNTAVVAVAALLETHMETLTDPMTRSEELQFVFCTEATLDTHAAPAKHNWATDAELLPPTANKGFQKFRVPGLHVTADQSKIPIKAGRFPLFWFITNDANDVDVT